MKNTFVVLTILFVALLTNGQTTNKTTNDVKIRQAMSAGGGNRMETVLYVKGQRMRNEAAGNMGFTTILQCDLKRTLTINEKTKSYLISPTDATSTPAAAGDGGAASSSPLSASLFDIPEGYTVAKDMQQLYGMGMTSSMSASSQPTDTTTNSNSAAPTPASAAKKPGVIRIRLLRPNVQMSAGNAAQAAENLRNTFASYLKGPNIEVVTLSAIEEARQSQCDYILSASMNVKKGGGSMFGRAIGNIASSTVGRIPASGATNSIKARDEVTLEYKLDRVEPPTTALTNKDKAKASADGEDVISPLVQKAAADVVARATQKQ
jgi:hypothetical protein